MSWREHRLSRRADFLAIFAGRRRFRGRLVELRCASNILAHARLGLAVPRRHAGNAVQRNMVRRMMREAFRARTAKLAGTDCLGTLRAACASAAQARAAGAEFATLLDRFAAEHAGRA